MGSPDTVKSVPYIILFDGVCNLCSGLVQFIIKRDKKNVFQFASLQSQYGQGQLEKFKLNPNQLHSIILIHDNQFYQRSDAAFEITKRLGGAWSLLYGFKVFPQFICDGVYTWVAKNRYRFFGKKDVCWVPSPEVSKRFIE